MLRDSNEGGYDARRLNSPTIKARLPHMNRPSMEMETASPNSGREPKPTRGAAQPLPLAAASVRLRGKPGRPRRDNREPEPALAVDAAPTPVPPRLLDVRATAAYLGLSPWTVRDLQAAGTLPRVIVPLHGGRELRKLLFDRKDLDRLIDVWKET